MTNKITRRQFGKGAAVSAAIVSTVGLSKPAAAKVKLQFGNAANAAYAGNIFAKAYFEEVKKRTNGEVETELFTGTLGGEKTILDRVALGTLDLFDGAYTGTREFDIFYAAALFRDYDHALKVINGPLRPQLEKLFEDRYNAKLIGVGRAGAFTLLTKDPIDSWTGIRNKKIRAGQIEGVLAGLKALGANATAIPFNEVYTALQQGVVDGQVTLGTLIVTQKYYEVVKHVIRQPFGLGLDKFVISKRAWDKLTADQQDIMMSTFNEMEATHWWNPVRDATDSTFAKWEEINGPGSVIDLDEGELQKEMTPVLRKLTDEIFGAGSWDRIQST